MVKKSVKTENIGIQGDGTNLILKDMELVMHDSMLPYAEHVIMDRALPRVEDGLKPVQRRILYTMYELGITPDKPYLKSARIVGDCMGKYHPHGDSSIYQAIVRMAQDFSLCMPLIDGQGNFGSIDGDGAAAMRYTEARLNPIALEMLADIDKDTVTWSRNYDDSRKEPDMLPSRYPNLLVNGANGIAVGLATNIPPHNFAEVIDGVIAYIDNEKITLNELMKIIKGPDFPTGGFVTSQDMEQIYSTGKGKLILRGKVRIENDKYDKKNIVVTELPYQVNKAQWLQSIVELREKYKDKLSCISEVVDESDKEGLRGVIRLKKDADTEEVLKYLYKYTDLEIGFSVNMVAIADGKPRQLGLYDIISYYTEYQKKVVTNRTKFDLKNAQDREHILKGLVIAVTNIDEVIAIIKNSDSTPQAKNKLMDTFDLSDIQAQAILDLRLARISKLEVNKLQEELTEVRKEIARLKAILSDKSLLMDVIKGELMTIKKAHRVPRRSIIVKSLEDIPVKSDDDIEIENFILALTNDNMLKKIPLKNYNMSNRDVSQGDISDTIAFMSNTKTFDYLFAVTNLGNCIKLDINSIAETKFRDKGTKINDIVKEMSADEKIVYMMTYSEINETDMIFVTESGMLKRSAMSDLVLNKQSFYPIIKLKDNDYVVAAGKIENALSVIMVTECGMALNVDINEIPVQGRTALGVQGMLVAENDKIIYAAVVNDEGEIIVVTDKGSMKKVLLCDFDISSRRRKGMKIIEFGINGTKLIFASVVTLPYKIALIGDNGIHIYNTDDIAIESRTHKGKVIVKGTVEKVLKILND